MYGSEGETLVDKTTFSISKRNYMKKKNKQRKNKQIQQEQV